MCRRAYRLPSLESSAALKASLAAPESVESRARWKLGHLLAKVKRAQGSRDSTSLTGLTKLLDRIGMTPPIANKGERADTGYLSLIGRLDLHHRIAMLAQRIGTLPWKVGQLLAKVERSGGRGKVSTGLKHLFARLDMTAQTAMLAQRIGTRC